MTLVPASSHGTAFNGGTITTPEVIDVAALATAGGLTIQGTSGANVNRLLVNFLHTLLQLTGDGVLNLSSDDTLSVVFHGVSSPASLEVYDNQASHVDTVIDSQTGLSMTKAGVGASMSIELTNAFKAGDLVSGGLFTSPPAPATVALVSGTEAQILSTRDAHTFTPVTFNPSAGASATCAVAIGSGTANVPLFTATVPPGLTFDGTIQGLYVYVPAAWFVKMTVVNAVLGTTTYY